MKHHAPALDLPLYSHQATEPFRLVPETATDHERLARETAQREADRQQSEQHQLHMPDSSQFTAYRFTQRNSDAAMTFIALSDNGFSPTWAEEAPSRNNPHAPRALLIQLPASEASRFRDYQHRVLRSLL